MTAIFRFTNGMVLGLLCWPLLLYAQSNYATFELRRDDNWGPLQFHDLNGDGALDIVVPHYDPALGRELHIYTQQNDGSFQATPQRIEIKTEIIAVGFADLRDEPGKELVLVANNGVFSLSTKQPGYAGNLKLLFEWKLLAGIPDLESVHFVNLATDINADGITDFLVPGDDRYGIFLGRGNEEFTLAATFSTLNEGMTPIQRRSRETDLDGELRINAEQGIVIDVRVETPTPFRGFIEQWQADAGTPDALLNSEQWMPTAVLAQLDADPLPDITYINAGENGLGQMNIHYQSAGQALAEKPQWQMSLDSSGDLELVDVNGDGLDDVMQLSGDGDNWTARFFLNRDGRFQFDQPDQVMRFSGYDTNLDIIQLEAGSKPVLSVSYYTIPVVDAIRNASINRVQLVYANTGNATGNIFGNRPASRLEERFSANNVRGLSEQMSLRFDIDGDGRKDALYITDKGTLAARRINDQLQITGNPFWEYVSPRTVLDFTVMALNDDELPDLILQHGTTTTVPVARP